MKGNFRIIGIVILLVVGAVIAGWLYYRANPGEWTAFLAEMGGDSAEPGFAPTLRFPTAAPSGLRASGNIEAEEVIVAAQLGGKILTLTADEGQWVSAGDILLTLDPGNWQNQREAAVADVAQAAAGVAAAQAELDLALAGATAEQIAAAEAAVTAAEGAVASAEAALLQAQITAESARTVQAVENSVIMAQASLDGAEGQVAAAEAGLAAAVAELNRLQSGSRPEEIALYQSLLNQAQANYRYYELLHYSNFIDKDIGGVPEEQARFLRDGAAGGRDAAQAQLDLVQAGATAYDLAAASAGVAAAQALVTMAEAGVTAAEAELAHAQANPTTSVDQVRLAEAGIVVADAQLAIANGQLAQASAELARLRAGASPETIAALEAGVAQARAAQTAAEASLRAAELDLSRTTLAAPVGGVIVQRLAHAGELAAPGAPLFTLADLAEATLTVYVPEAELGKVALGQTVDVTVDAYSDVFPGEVILIASQAEFTPKNVQTQEERVHMVFAVKIRLDNPDGRLKPGMPADALFK